MGDDDTRHAPHRVPMSGQDVVVAAARRLRVVVVDNDPDALDLVLTDLRLEGHDIVGSGLDGTTALELCERLHPDVAVIDHRMPPGPHGLEVAQRLSEAAPDVRVIVFTNYQDRKLIDAVKASGATYLPKGNLRLLRRAVIGGTATA